MWLHAKLERISDHLAIYRIAGNLIHRLAVLGFARILVGVHMNSQFEGRLVKHRRVAVYMRGDLGPSTLAGRSGPGQGRGRSLGLNPTRPDASAGQVLQGDLNPDLGILSIRPALPHVIQQYMDHHVYTICSRQLL